MDHVAIEWNEAEMNLLTEQVIACAFTVANTLGNGFVERVYSNALAHELRKRHLSAKREAPILVWYDDVVVGEFFADLLVNQKLLVEAKAVRTDLNVFMPQCLNYLKATNLPLCLLLNFGHPRVEIRRFRR